MKKAFFFTFAFILSVIAMQSHAYWKNLGAGGQRVGFAQVSEQFDPYTQQWQRNCEGTGALSCFGTLPITVSDHQNAFDHAVSEIQANNLSGSWTDITNGKTVTWTASDDAGTTHEIIVQ